MSKGSLKWGKTFYRGRGEKGGENTEPSINFGRKKRRGRREGDFTYPFCWGEGGGKSVPQKRREKKRISFFSMKGGCLFSPPLPSQKMEGGGGENKTLTLKKTI